MDNLTAAVVTSYREHYGTEPDVIVRAPGRVNLIGEHTDYTGGFVLPTAIDRDIVIAAGRSTGNSINGYSVDFNEHATTHTGMYNPNHPSIWFRYIMGVLDELSKTSRQVNGFRFTAGGNVPIGAGLSSSAALEVATLTATETLFDWRFTDRDAALLCQRAENNFVGMNCGIMDQYISRAGLAGHAVLIDCDDLSIRPVVADLPGWQWLVIDSKKRRGLVDSAYNRRREECETGLLAARQAFPHRTLSNLRDLTPDDLCTLEQVCDPVVFKRVRHVVTENARVLDTVGALERGDAEAVGRLLAGSHTSLRDDFEVSCAELDLLVDILSEVNGVAGARMTGGGFGGCAVCLVHENAVEHMDRVLDDKYRPNSLPADTHAVIWPVRASDGARALQTEH